MSLRPGWVAVVLTGLAIGGAVPWGAGRRQLATAQVELARALEGGTPPQELPPRPPGASGAETPNLSADERLELMRLRRDVTELKARRRDLQETKNQIPALQAKLAALTNGIVGRLPPGYVRMTDARQRGSATPEAAVETFFWAMVHRDPLAFMSVAPAEDVEDIRRKVESGGADEFFGASTPVPGFRVAGREELGPDEVRLHIEVVLGNTMPMRLRRDPSNGFWRTAAD